MRIKYLCIQVLTYRWTSPGYARSINALGLQNAASNLVRTKVRRSPFNLGEDGTIQTCGADRAVSSQFRNF